MWCTRWFLPLVILPLPTAPPYFLAVFLLSMFLHARPCFYCMMLLTALFTSSCYWQAVSIDAPLTRPLGNATTFGEAIRANLSVPERPNAVELELPPFIQLLDRCWCSVFSRSGLFEPTNVSAWELASVERARREIEAHISKEAEGEGGNEERETEDMGKFVVSASDKVEVEVEEGDEHSQLTSGNSFSLRGLRNLFFPTTTPSSATKYRLKPGSTPSDSSVSSTDASESYSPEWSSGSSEEEDDFRESQPLGTHSDAATATPSPTQPAKLLRSYYDLRPYGLDITIDFRWNRQ